jgi:hypothetical protein
MFEALLIVACLGLVWTFISGLLLVRRVQKLEHAIYREQVDVASRLDTLEAMARDRWLAESTSLGDQVTAMIETLQTTARQSTREIADLKTQLEQLLQQADEARSRLVVALEQASRPPANAMDQASGPLADVPPAWWRVRELHAGSTSQPAPPVSPATNGTPDAGVAPPRPAPPAAARHVEVRRLAAEGLAPAEIARHTGLGVAEIELMLRLGRPARLFSDAPDRPMTRERGAPFAGASP